MAARLVAVIGAAECSISQAEQAEEVGRLLAEAGAVVVCGGGGGVMAAACRGAKSRGGLSIGILPGANAEASNQWVDIPIATGLGEARNAIIVRAAQAVIAVGGGYGTLSEIGFALKWGKRVVGLDTWDLPAAERPGQAVIAAASAADAVRLALASRDG